MSDSNGGSLGINSYDEYGNPGGTLTGRYGYTGQAWLPSAGLWYYKARIYHPELGRFMQTDPIGYWDSPNLYAYVGNDPVNWVDPLGLRKALGPRCLPGDICVTGVRPEPQQQPIPAHAQGGGSPNVQGSGGSGKKPQPKPKPKPETADTKRAQCSPTQSDSVKSGAIAGSFAYGGELLRMGVMAARGASVGALFIHGAVAASGGTAIVAFLVVGGAVYAYDQYTGGDVTRFLSSQIKFQGCP